RYAEVIGDPAAGDRLPPRPDESLPVLIHLLLRVAQHRDGDPFVERELRASIESDKLASVERELDSHHAPDLERRLRPQIGITRGARDVRVWENRRVEP